MNEKFCILIKISLNFVNDHLIYNKSALVEGNGLVQNRQQAIIWTNAEPVMDTYMPH